jgi:hypothetical protein
VKRVFGHRRVSSTECPGDELNSVLKRIRAAAQERITEHGGLPPAEPAD